MGNGSGKLDITHTLTTNAGLRNFYAATVTDKSLITDLLVLSAMTFPVLCGSEDLLAEQTVALGLQRSVVDGFRLLYFVIGNVTLTAGSRPLLDFLGRGKTDLNGVVGNFFYFLIIEII